MQVSKQASQRVAARYLQKQADGLQDLAEKIQARLMRLLKKWPVLDEVTQQRRGKQPRIDFEMDVSWTVYGPEESDYTRFDRTREILQNTDTLKALTVKELSDLMAGVSLVEVHYGGEGQYDIYVYLKK